jgi:PAS domain S-box-containing protein
MGRHTIGLFITNPIDRGLLSDFLRQLGHEVYASALSTREPEFCPGSSLVIADEEAARFYGRNLLELKWRAGVDFLPLLIVLPQKSNSASWLQAGFDDVLRQPVTKDELKARLEVFLRFRRHSEQYRLIFENALVGIYRSTSDGRLLMANPTLIRMLGFSSFDELSQETLKEQGIRTEPARRALAERLAREGQVTGLESSWTRRDGTTLFALESARAVRDEAGHMLYLEGAVEDITGRKQAEAKLLQLAAIVENSEDAIVSKGLDGTIISWNPGAERLYGYRATEATGLPVTILIPPDRPDEEPQIIERIKRGDRVEHFETVRLRKDGTHVDVSLTVSPVKDEGGRIIGASHIARDITDRKRAEQALRESEARYQAIVAALTEGITLHDAEGVIRAANQSAERILGLTQDQMSGRTSFDPRWRAVREDGSPFPGEEHPPVVALRTGEPQSNVIMGIHRPDDTLVWLSVNAQPLLDDEGKPAGVVSSFFDFTARLRAEEQVRRQLDFTEAITNNLGEGIFAVDPEGRVTFMNPAAEQMLGWGEAELLGRNVHESIHFQRPDGAPYPADECPFLNALRSGTGVRAHEETFTAKDGAMFPVLCSSTPIVTDGMVTGAVMAFQDITERKRAEDALREQTEVVETINRVGQTLSAELDLQKVVQTVTDAATDLVGARFGSFFYNVLDEQGGSYMLYTLSGVPREAFAHFPMPRATDLFGPTFRGEGVVRIDDVKLDPRYGKNSPYHGMPKGHLPVTSYLAVPVISRSGEVLGGLFFGHPEAAVFTERDERIVTGLAAQAAIAMDNARLFELAGRERAQAESAARENARLYEEAERANRLKDEFLATVSHELRTPLTAIIGWSTLLRNNNLDAANAAIAIETIGRNARAQSQLIEDLMDVSRIITGKLRLDVQTVELESVIEAAIDSLRPAAEARGIRLLSVLDPHAGPVSGDPTRLQQVAWNLLSNAIKFTPKGGRVEVRLERIDSHVEFVVSDTGAGIEPEFLPYVFDRFRQADGTTTRAHGGLGLGLAIVRHLVELHGGSVQVDSRGKGQGATFTVILPLRIIKRELGSEERRHPAAEIGATTECPPELDGLRVLIVDDEPDARHLLKTILEQCGAEVTVMASVQEAIEEIERSRPDVLVSDVGMPEEDGYTLMRKVRALDVEHGGQIPAAALTAYAGAEDRKRALLAGFQVHIPKPVDPAELVAAVASLAGRTGKA